MTTQVAVSRRAHRYQLALTDSQAAINGGRRERAGALLPKAWGWGSDREDRVNEGFLPSGGGYTQEPFKKGELNIYWGVVIEETLATVLVRYRSCEGYSIILLRSEWNKYVRGKWIPLCPEMQASFGSTNSVKPSLTLRNRVVILIGLYIWLCDVVYVSIPV